MESKRPSPIDFKENCSQIEKVLEAVDFAAALNEIPAVTDKNKMQIVAAFLTDCDIYNKHLLKTDGYKNNDELKQNMSIILLLTLCSCLLSHLTPLN